MPYFTQISTPALNSSIGRLASIVSKQRPELSVEAARAIATTQALKSASERSARFAYQNKPLSVPLNDDPIQIDPERLASVRKRVAYATDFSTKDTDAVMASIAKQDVLKQRTKGFRSSDDVFGSDALARRVFRGYGRTDSFVPSDVGDYYTVAANGQPFLTETTAKRLNNVRSFDAYKAAFDRIQSAEGGKRHFRNGLYRWYNIDGHLTIGHGFDAVHNKDLLTKYPNGITPVQNDSLLVNRYLPQYERDIKRDMPYSTLKTKNPNQLGAVMSGIHHRGSRGFFHSKNDMAGMLSDPKATPEMVATNWFKFPVRKKYKTGFFNRAAADSYL